MTLKIIKEKLIKLEPFDPDNTSRLTKIEQLVGPYSELRLCVKNSLNLAKNFIININHFGHPEGQYKGVVFFGLKKKARKFGEKINDIIIKSEYKDRGRSFVIYFCPDNSQFYLRDLGIGPGVYIKLDHIFKLESDILINIGESYLYFSIVQSENFPNLFITVFSQNKARNYCLYAQEQHISPVKIGRAEDCQICIEDMMISKYQASILYSHSKGWIMIDGNIIKQRPSTNGAW